MSKQLVQTIELKLLVNIPSWSDVGDQEDELRELTNRLKVKKLPILKGIVNELFSQELLSYSSDDARNVQILIETKVEEVEDSEITP